MLTVQRMNVAFTSAEMAARACANKHETRTQGQLRHAMLACHQVTPEQQ